MEEVWEVALVEDEVGEGWEEALGEVEEGWEVALEALVVLAEVEVEIKSHLETKSINNKPKTTAAIGEVLVVWAAVEEADSWVFLVLEVVDQTLYPSC